MDSAKRERLIELGSQIAGWRAEIASFQSKIAEAEIEIDRLFPDNTSSSNPAMDGAGPPSAPTHTPVLRHPSLVGLQPGAEVPNVRTTEPELVIPSVIGNLADQALAVLKANPDAELSSEVITGCMNRMQGRTSTAASESVNAALSRLASEGLITRVERGIYKVKPMANVG
jgi:hypothetical protein